MIDTKSILTPTAVVGPGMRVRDVFLECARAHVQALPYADDSGRLVGRLTLKNIMKFSCLPAYMVELAPLLGKQMSCVDNAETKAREIICNPVEPYVLDLAETMPSSAPLIKALALMEKHDTRYIFVVDDGAYQGIITIQGIAQRMTELDVCEIPQDARPA